MKKGDYVRTPRFLNVKVEKVFRSEENAKKAGFTEPTYYDDCEFGVAGKVIGVNRIIFAGYKK